MSVGAPRMQGDIAATSAPAARPILPRQFAVKCPQCRRGSLHDEQPQCPSCGFQTRSEGRICILEHAPREEDYSPEGALVQNEVREQHFWFEMRNRFILRMLATAAPASPRGRFVEYGCSNGLVMRALEEAGWTVLGTDMHLSGLRTATELVHGPLVCAPLETIAFADAVDALGFFDVIEHLDDDFGALRRACEQLRPGGLLLVTAPAFQNLWSDFDLLLGHKRRYTGAQLAALFARLGLETVTVRYAFSSSFPLVWLQRRLVRKGPAATRKRSYYRPPPPAVNTLLGFLCRVEMAAADLGIRLPFGTSVMGVARKPAGAPQDEA